MRNAATFHFVNDKIKFHNSQELYGRRDKKFHADMIRLATLHCTTQAEHAHKILEIYKATVEC